MLTRQNSAQQALKKHHLVPFICMMAVMLFMLLFTTPPAAADQDDFLRIEAGELSYEQALAIALKTAPSGQMLSWELDLSKGIKIYEMDLLAADTLYALHINAKDGSVLSAYNRPAWENEARLLLPETMAPYASVDEIVAAASQAYPDAQVTGFSADFEDGMPEYEVSLIRSHEGQASPHERLLFTANLAGNPAPASESIDEAAARKIALDRVGGGDIVKFWKDWDDGIAVYEIEIHWNGVEYEVEIEASNGKIRDFDQSHIEYGDDD